MFSENTANGRGTTSDTYFIVPQSTEIVVRVTVIANIIRTVLSLGNRAMQRVFPTPD